MTSPPPPPHSASSQVSAEFTRLPLPGLEGRFGVQQFVQLPADLGHVELRRLAPLRQGGRLHPQLRGGRGELLAALAALQLHPLGVVEEGLHAHRHGLALVEGHVLESDGRKGQRVKRSGIWTLNEDADWRLGGFSAVCLGLSVICF